MIIGLLISTLHFSLFYYSHDTPKWFVFDIATTLYIAFSLKDKKQIQFSYLGALILVLVYLMIISLWWAPHKVAGLEFVIRFTNSVLLAYCLLKKYSNEKLLDILLNTIFISALGFSIIFILERYILGLSFNVGTFSPIGFINNTSAVFNIWIPGLVIYGIRNKNNFTRCSLSVISLLVVISVLMEAGTRGAILGLSISELIIFLIVLRKNRRQAIAFLTITALLLLGIGIYNVSDSLQNGRLDAKLSVMKNSIGQAGESRLNMIDNTWQMTLDNPLGVGINNWEYIHPKYAQVGTPGASPFINENQILRTPHNLIMKILGELGFLGGVLFSLLIIYCFLIAIYNAIKGDYVDKWVFVAVSATLFHTMVSAVLLTPTSLFFFVLIMAVVMRRFLSHNEQKDRFTLRLPSMVKGLYLSIIVVACLLLLSEYYAFKGRTTYDGDYLREAVQLNPQNDRALLNISQYYFYRDKNLDASLNSLDQFLSLYPYHIAGLMMKAERQYQLGNLIDAQETLKKLIGFYPGYKKAHRLEQLISIKIKRQEIDRKQYQ